MPRIFIDVTGDERHWNGDLAVAVKERDDLLGTDMALAFGDHQIVLTITQAISLYEVLDAHLHAGPMKEVGAITTRLRMVIESLTDERMGVFKPMFGALYSQDRFVRDLADHIRAQGLRFKMTKTEP